MRETKWVYRTQRHVLFVRVMGSIRRQSCGLHSQGSDAGKLRTQRRDVWGIGDFKTRVGGAVQNDFKTIHQNAGIQTRLRCDH